MIGEAMRDAARSWLLVAACLPWWTAACGDDDAPVEIDATPPMIDAADDGTCRLPAGTAFTSAYFRMLPAKDGYDLDGDDEVDNALGNMPRFALDSINDGFAQSIDDGAFLAIAYVSEWSDPPTPSDPDVGFHIFGAIDGDEPPDPSNNKELDTPLYVSLSHFDVNCESTVRADEASITDYELTARRQRWGFPIGDFELVFARAIVVATIDETLTSIDGRLGGVIPFCSLSGFAAPGELPGSALDLLVNNAAIREAVSPDMDLDGDGLEQVIGDGIGILECIDGDGTVISGSDCPCDPAIADGYSFAADLGGPRAMLLGVR